MAKTKCRPERTDKNAPKRVKVRPHKRSAPKPINRKCT